MNRFSPIASLTGLVGLILLSPAMAQVRVVIEVTEDFWVVRPDWLGNGTQYFHYTVTDSIKHGLGFGKVWRFEVNESDKGMKWSHHFNGEALKVDGFKDLVVTYRAFGVNTSYNDFFLYLYYRDVAGAFGEVHIISQRDLIADAAWHTLFVSLPAGIDEIHMMALMVQVPPG